MGSWRTDVWIKKNDDKGNEITTAKYNYIGRGKTFNFQPNNNWKTVSGMGSKFIQIQAAGKYGVSGNLVTYLDYNNFYHLIGAFEEYTTSKETIGETTVYHHSYKKSNLQRIPSFTMIARKLNRKVGGGYDETTKFEKVYFQGITLNWESGNPVVKVTYQWKAVYNETEFKDCPEGLELADADALNPEYPVEWGCLSYSDDGINFTPIATNEKTKMTFSTGLGEIGKCGSRYATDFNEQGTGEVTTESTVYSRDGHWLRRLYYGGKIDADKLDAGGKMGPLAKGLKPIPYMRISSFEKEAIGDSTHRVIVTLQNVMVKTMNQDYGSSSSITDSPTLTATRTWLDIYTPDIDFNVYTKTAIGGTDLIVTNPVDGFRQDDDASLDVTGKTEVGANATISFNGSADTPMTLDIDGKFTYPVSLAEGSNTFVIKSKKGDKGETSVTLNGKFFRHPALQISSPIEGQAVTSPFNLEGISDADDKTVIECIFNGGTPMAITKIGQAFSQTLTPIAGENTIIVTAKRTVEGETLENTETIKVTYTP